MIMNRAEVDILWSNAMRMTLRMIENRKFQMPSNCRDGLDYKSIWPVSINVNQVRINVNNVNVDDMWRIGL